MYKYIESKFGRTLSSLDYQKINDLLEKYSEDEIKKAVDIAYNNNSKNINYIITTLANMPQIELPKWFDGNIPKEKMDMKEFLEVVIDHRQFFNEYEEYKQWVVKQVGFLDGYTSEEKNKAYSIVILKTSE